MPQNQSGANWQLEIAIMSATPAWILVGYRRDLSMDESADKCDTTTVNDAGYKNSVAGQRGWSFSFNHLWVVSAAGYALLRLAYRSGESIMARVLDGTGMALTTALASGTPATALAVSALTEVIPSGTKLRVGTTAVHTDVVTTADAQIGDVSIPITSVTPAATLAIGTLIAVGSQLTQPDAVSGHSGLVWVSKMSKKMDVKEVFVDIALEGQGVLTDIG